MKKKIIFLLLTLAGLRPLFAAPTAYQVIKRGEEQMRGDTSYSKVKMTVEKTRFSRTMVFESYDSRVQEKFFIHILEPKKDKGTTFLKVKNNLWQYIPEIGKEIKIEASLMHDSWMGSDFTYDHLVKQSSIIEDYNHAFLETDKEDFYKIELTPKLGAPVTWNKIIIFSRKKDSLPVREEFYDHKDRLKKLMLLSNFKVMDGRLIPAKMVMGSVENGRVRSKTTMEFLTVDFNVSFSPYIFSKARLRNPR
jgi:hypothetical protein